MPRLRRLELARRDAGPRGLAHGASARAPPAAGTGPVPLAALAEADVAAAPGRHRRARPRPRRRPGPGLARARRRRAGDRQVDAPAAGGGRPRRGGGAGPLRHRRGIGRPGPPAGGRLGPPRRSGRRRPSASSPRRGRADRRGGARACGRRAVIVDSIQTATVDELDGPAGSVGQVRESALRLMELAKGEGIAVILVGHVTKDGSIAGPKTLEHLVDAVRQRSRASGGGTLRLVRASKNRFGSTDEVGVLEMGEAGLREVADPARAFLVEHDGAGARERRRGHARGSARAARRGPGARRTDRLRDAPADRDRARPEPARAARGGARPAGRRRPRDARRLRQPGRRDRGRPTRASTCRSRSPSPRPCGTGRCAPGTVAFGEVGLLGELRAVGGTGAAAARGGPPRLHPRASCRAPRRAPAGGRRASTVVAVRDRPRGARRSPSEAPGPARSEP